MSDNNSTIISTTTNDDTTTKATTTTPAAVASSTVDAISEGLFVLGYSLISLEFMLHLLLLPLIVINFYVIVPTSIIHRNLKFILLCQNCDILLFTLSRIVYLSLKLLLGAFYAGMPQLKAPTFFAFLYSNWLGHVLLLERVMATYFAKTYERSRNPWFSICWFPVTLLLTSHDTYTQIIDSANIRDITTGTLVLFAAILVCSFFEFIISSILIVYNESIFKENLFVPAVHNLSERYQLSENVKTTRQLRPALFLHFVIILLSSGVTFALHLNIFTTGVSVELMLMLFYLGTTLANLFIVVTVVGHHPLLRKKVGILLSELLARLGASSNKVTATIDSQSNRTASAGAPNVMADKMHRTEEYFKTLNQYWTHTHKMH